MAYCPECGGNNTNRTGGFNLYDGGDYTCYDCEIDFYYGITKRDIGEVEE